MTSDNSKIKKKILKICKRLHARNMLAAADGNVSVRLKYDQILITPSGVAKAFMDSDEIAIINLQGDVISGNPSGERLMHLEVYRRCPQAQAVIHAHPPHAIAFSIARPELKELPAESMSELILATGKIPIVSYARPGTASMGEVLANHLPEHRVMILARHGALSWGEDLDEAHRGMERVEHSAQILYLAEQLGGITFLPQEEVAYLRKMRQKIGDKSL